MLTVLQVYTNHFVKRNFIYDFFRSYGDEISIV